jgi:hypothetical protein
MISGGRDERITVQGQSEKKISKILSQHGSPAWWCIPIIPGAQEAAVEGFGLRLVGQQHKAISGKVN